MIEVILIVLSILLLVGELFIWDQAIFWHSKEKPPPLTFSVSTRSREMVESRRLLSQKPR